MECLLSRYFLHQRVKCVTCLVTCQPHAISYALQSFAHFHSLWALGSRYFWRGLHVYHHQTPRWLTRTSLSKPGPSALSPVTLLPNPPRAMGGIILEGRGANFRSMECSIIKCVIPEAISCTESRKYIPAPPVGGCLPPCHHTVLSKYEVRQNSREWLS